MPHMIQRNLIRGKKANRLGIGLFVLMAACLLVSLAMGVSGLFA